MLKLERLEIAGFKSFADRTVLDFGEGITGVVGPNGCGKSNIAEAISWVLGEQSAKTLRGSKMEDVIFNGTRDRKPTGMAEVSLRLVATADIASRDPDEASNEDESKFDRAIQTAEQAASAAEDLIKQAEQPESLLPSVSAEAPSPTDGPTDGNVAEVPAETSVGESQGPHVPTEADQHAAETQGPKHAAKRHSYRPRKSPKILLSAGEKITIGRRLYRTGESDYLMNGKLCLLRDIQDLFAGTGLGGAHYAIIEQGKIGQILSSKPLDRRALIEEAAGITKFKTRKRLAELKLESARQNLTRLNDIISEVERQVNSLKRQAAKARRYRRLRDEMRSLLRLIFTADYYRLNRSAEQIASQLEQAQASISELDACITGREAEYSEISTEARAAEDNLSNLKEQAAAVDLDLDRVRNRRKFEEQQLAELTARMDENGRAQQSLTDRLSVLDSEIERKGGDLKSLQEQVNQQKSELLDREKRYQADLSRLRQAEAHIEKLRQQLFVESGNAERMHSGLSGLQDALRRLDLRRTNLDAELERATARSQELAGNRSEVEVALAGGQESLAGLSTRITDAETRLTAAKEKVGVLRPQLESVQADRSAAERTLTSLEEVDARHAYFSDAVQQVLAPEHAARVNALGTLADFVQADPQYERLIESLFGRELQSILVPTIDDALAGVEYLKTEGLGRGAFLVVGLHGAEGGPSDFYIENDGSDENSDLFGEGEPPRNRQTDASPAPTDQKSSIAQPIADQERLDRGSHIEPKDTPGVQGFQREIGAVSEDNAEAYLLAGQEGYEPPELREIQEIDWEQAPEPGEADEVKQDHRPQETAGAEISGGELDSDAKVEEGERHAEMRYDREAEIGLRFELEVLRAVDLMGLRPEIKSITERAFPDKCSALVVPDIEAALHLSMENGWRTYVTYEGEQVVNGRLIVTGAQAGKKGASLLAIKREIRQLRERTLELIGEDERLAGELSEARKELEQAEGEFSSLSREFSQQEKRVGSLQTEFDSLGRELERAEQHVAVVQSELELTGGERTDLLGRISQAELSLLAAEGARNLAQHTLKVAQAEFAVMRSAVEQLSEQVSAARAAAAARVERLRAAEAEIKRLESEAEDLNSRINRIRLEMYDSQTRAEQLRASQDEGAVELARLESDSLRLAGEVAGASDHLTSVRARSDQLEKLLSQLRVSAGSAREQRSHIEVEQAKLQSEAEHLARMCVTELAASLPDVVAAVEAEIAQQSAASGFDEETIETTPDDGVKPVEADGSEAEAGCGQAVSEQNGLAQGAGAQETVESISIAGFDHKDDETPGGDFGAETSASETCEVQSGSAGQNGQPEFDVESARIRLDEIRVKIDELGSVNMMALEELEESEKRFAFLSSQRADILESIKGTEEAIAEIKRRSRDRFRHAFTHINENFQSMFLELFGGGRGEMILIDEEDVLESGIDLIAQPPGKRLQNVLLLSGGEKAMAALALVLAIFQYRPSPFCILDEVDAPLDEANVGRFAGKVTEMSRETQFLMITHNKRSMEAARALYGVTMEELGVSKLVSVRFD